MLAVSSMLFDMLLILFASSQGISGNDDVESEDPALSLEDVPDEESEDSAGSWWEPPPKERPEPLMPRPRQGAESR
eukprot:s4636_g4.t1